MADKVVRPTHLMIESLNERVSDTRKMVSVGIALVLAFSAATFGLTLGAAEFAKESHISGNNSVMTDVNGNVVQTKNLYRQKGVEELCAYNAEQMAEFLTQIKDFTSHDDGVSKKRVVLGYEHDMNTNAVELFTEQGSINLTRSFCGRGDNTNAGRRHMLQTLYGHQATYHDRWPPAGDIETDAGFSDGSSGDHEGDWDYSGDEAPDSEDFAPAVIYFKDPAHNKLRDAERACENYNKIRFKQCELCANVFDSSQASCGNGSSPASDGHSGGFYGCNITPGSNPWVLNGLMPLFAQDGPHTVAPAGTTCQMTHNGIPHRLFASTYDCHDGLHESGPFTRSNRRACTNNLDDLGVSKVEARVCLNTSCDIGLQGCNCYPADFVNPGAGRCEVTVARDTPFSIGTTLSQPFQACFEANQMGGNKCASPSKGAICVFYGMTNNGSWDLPPEQPNCHWNYCQPIRENYRKHCRDQQKSLNFKIYSHSWGTVRPGRCDLSIYYAAGLCPPTADACWRVDNDGVPGRLCNCCKGNCDPEVGYLTDWVTSIVGMPSAGAVNGIQQCYAPGTSMHGTYAPSATGIALGLEDPCPCHMNLPLDPSFSYGGQEPLTVNKNNERCGCHDEQYYTIKSKQYPAFDCTILGVYHVFDPCYGPAMYPNHLYRFPGAPPAIVGAIPATAGSWVPGLSRDLGRQRGEPLWGTQFQQWTSVGTGGAGGASSSSSSGYSSSYSEMFFASAGY